MYISDFKFQISGLLCIGYTRICASQKLLGGRGVNDSGLESAPEYEFGSFLEILDGDSGSGSFLVWSRFQPGIGSTSEAGTKFPC